MLGSGDPILKVLSVAEPVIQGEDTIKAITAYLNGEEVPEDYLSKAKIVDGSNIADFGWEEVVALREK